MRPLGQRQVARVAQAQCCLGLEWEAFLVLMRAAAASLVGQALEAQAYFRFKRKAPAATATAAAAEACSVVAVPSHS